MSSASDETRSRPLALVASARRGRLSLLDMIFSVRGYRVAACQNGPEVLEYLKTNVPEVAVLDHDLPGMNGREICSRMRLIGHLTNVPVALVMPSLDELGGVAEFEEFAQTTRADIVVAEPLGKRNLVDHLETLTRERKATGPTADRAWSPPVMLPAPSSIAAGSSIQQAYERGELAGVEDPEFDLDLLPGEVVLTESIGDHLPSRASIRRTSEAVAGSGDGREHQPHGQNGFAAPDPVLLDERRTDAYAPARPDPSDHSSPDASPNAVEEAADGTGALDEGLEAAPGDHDAGADAQAQDAVETHGRPQGADSTNELRGSQERRMLNEHIEAAELPRANAATEQAETPLDGQQHTPAEPERQEEPVDDAGWSGGASPASWDPRDSAGTPVPSAAERGVPDVEAMSARIAEALRKEELSEQDYAGQSRSGRSDSSAEGPELGEERVGVQGQAANADLLTIGAEALERMDGVHSVREEGPNVQALLERRDIMQALIEEQAERINSLQQRNVALRRELDQQKARDKERQDELDNLKALIQEQNETVETLQERNVSLRQDLDQHKADTSKRDSELEYLRKQAREQGETITHFQQVAEVLWQELEQRKADEGPLRDFLQRLLDRDEHANFESLRDDMQRLRRLGDKS